MLSVETRISNIIKDQSLLIKNDKPKTKSRNNAKYSKNIHILENSEFNTWLNWTMWLTKILNFLFFEYSINFSTKGFSKETNDYSMELKNRSAYEERRKRVKRWNKQYNNINKINNEIVLSIDAFKKKRLLERDGWSMRANQHLFAFSEGNENSESGNNENYRTLNLEIAVFSKKGEEHMVGGRCYLRGGHHQRHYIMRPIWFSINDNFNEVWDRLISSLANFNPYSRETLNEFKDLLNEEIMELKERPYLNSSCPFNDDGLNNETMKLVKEERDCNPSFHFNEDSDDEYIFDETNMTSYPNLNEDNCIEYNPCDETHNFESINSFDSFPYPEQESYIVEDIDLDFEVEDCLDEINSPSWKEDTPLEEGLKQYSSYFWNPSFVSCDASKYLQKIILSDSTNPNVFITKYKCNMSLKTTHSKITTLKYSEDNSGVVSEIYIEFYEENKLLETGRIWRESHKDTSNSLTYREWSIHVDNTDLGLGKVITKFKSIISKGKKKADMVSLNVNRVDKERGNNHDVTIDPNGKAEVKVATKKKTRNKNHFIGYKAVVGKKGEKLLLEMEIPKSAKIASNIHAAGKLRTNHVIPTKFYSVEIQIRPRTSRSINDDEFSPIDIADFILYEDEDRIRAYSFVQKKEEGFVYKLNEPIKLKPSEFHSTMDMVCVKGIHFCMTPEEALEYHLVGALRIGSVDLMYPNLECNINSFDEDFEDIDDSHKNINSFDQDAKNIIENVDNVDNSTRDLINSLANKNSHSNHNEFYHKISLDQIEEESCSEDIYKISVSDVDNRSMLSNEKSENKEVNIMIGLEDSIDNHVMMEEIVQDEDRFKLNEVYRSIEEIQKSLKSNVNTYREEHNKDKKDLILKSGPMEPNLDIVIDEYAALPGMSTVATVDHDESMVENLEIEEYAALLGIPMVPDESMVENLEIEEYAALLSMPMVPDEPIFENLELLEKKERRAELGR